MHSANRSRWCDLKESNLPAGFFRPALSRESFGRIGIEIWKRVVESNHPKTGFRALRLSRSANPLRMKKSAGAWNTDAMFW